MGKKDVNDMKAAQWRANNADSKKEKEAAIADEIAAANRAQSGSKQEFIEQYKEGKR